MADWITLSRELHKESHWQPRQGYKFASDYTTIPVVINELAKIIPDYVIAFIKRGEGQYEAGAIVRLYGEHSLYINEDSKWVSTYVPAHLRCFPFAMLESAEDNFVLCIEKNHLTDNLDCPKVFKRDGELDESVSEKIDLVSAFAKNRQMTQKATQELASFGLIVPWQLSIYWPSLKGSLNVEGLYKIDEEAMSNLNAEEFATLRETGALLVAYAQLFSMSQVDRLMERALALSETVLQKPHSNLEGILGEGDNNVLDFDAF